MRFARAHCVERHPRALLQSSLNGGTLSASEFWSYGRRRGDSTGKVGSQAGVPVAKGLTVAVTDAPQP
jgi:hypothetical protein